MRTVYFKAYSRRRPAYGIFDDELNIFVYKYRKRLVPRLKIKYLSVSALKAAA